MSGIFSKAKAIKVQQQEPISDVKVVKEEAEVSRRRERKKLLASGRRKTIISGIQSALKEKLGGKG